jgi:hypothetical protein
MNEIELGNSYPGHVLSLLIVERASESSVDARQRHTQLSASDDALENV